MAGDALAFDWNLRKICIHDPFVCGGLLASSPLFQRHKNRIDSRQLRRIIDGQCPKVRFLVVEFEDGPGCEGTCRSYHALPRPGIHFRLHRSVCSVQTRQTTAISIFLPYRKHGRKLCSPYPCYRRRARPQSADPATGRRFRAQGQTARCSDARVALGYSISHLDS